MTFHALIDLSDLPAADPRLTAALAALTQADNVAGLAADITCLVPKGTPTPAVGATRWRWVEEAGVEAAHAAVVRAGRDGAHLLVLLEAIATAVDAAADLAAAFAIDPLFGAVHPRFSNDGGATLLPVLNSQRRDGGVPTRALLDLPAYYILPEYVSRCFVVRHELLANVEPSRTPAKTPALLLLAYLRQARRVGFRTIVVNTVVVPLCAKRRGPVDAAVAAAIEQDADSSLAHRRFARHADLTRERRLASIHAAKPKVLIDARNLSTTINGTTKALIGLADGLRDRDPAWAITFLASSDATDSHALRTRYPGWTLEPELPDDEVFAAAFRPSQPWALSELIDLHRAAAVNVFLMLDTIAWDVVYTAPNQLDATWRFAAQYADALLFISDFSRQRFATRFPVHADVRMDVCHLSLDPADYVDADANRKAADTPFWFVVGNHYDHKHLQPTVALLSRAFPTTRLAVLGAAANGQRVNGHASGQLTERDVQALFAGAELVIFPSLYEGFGLPIVNALAYGRPVVARDSALLREIAAAYVGPGRLVPFTTPDTLVERLMHLRRGLSVLEVPLRQPGPAPHGWNAAAAIVETHINDLLRPRRTRRERERHETVLLLDEWAQSSRGL